MNSNCTFIGLLLLCVMIVGCGETETDTKLKLIPVEGKITVKSEPATGAKVTLHPVEGAVADAGLFPSGVADESGRFVLSTYEAGDGVPVGNYQVTVVWPDTDFKPKKISDIEDAVQGGELPDKLKGRYAQPKTSKLTASIESGTTELPVIELK